jgi:hypothetical protein
MKMLLVATIYVADINEQNFDWIVDYFMQGVSTG